MSTSAERAGGVGSPPRDRLVTVGVAAAVVALLAAVAFPFAPVVREEVTYRWWSFLGSQATAIPMLPYQPARATASVTCPVAATNAGAVLATVPPVLDPRAEPLSGLRVSSDGRGPTPTVTVESGGTTIGTVRLPPDCLALEVSSDAAATVLVVQDRRTGAAPGEGTEVARVDGDVRPAVAGAFTVAPSGSGGVGLEVVGDTRFQTSPTPFKIALGVLAALAAAAVLVVLARLDRRSRTWRGPPEGTDDTGPGGTGPRRARRVADLGVLAGLALWQVVGPMTVDDGYIAGIVRSRFGNGQVGTVFRWLNSPETPFGWFYDVLAGIAALDPAPFWLRLPSTLLGIVAWFLLTRALLPRLRLPVGPLLRVPGALVAGVLFLAWWLPFDLGVRPEPWVVVGWTTVVLALERGLARRTLLPVGAALVVAGATLAVTPTGLVAFTPFLVAAAPLLRGARDARARVGAPLLALGALGLLATTLLLVYSDQTWASALDSVDIRRLVGGDRPWTDEYVRYASLLTVGNAEGNLGRRAPVLTLLVALVALALPALRARFRELVDPGPARRLVAGTVAALAVLALTPTKWTHHFGAFAVVGTALTLLALHAWAGAASDASRTAPRRAAAAIAVAAGTAGLVLAGLNQWHWLSTYALTWTDIAPQLGGVRFADAVLVLGAVLAVVAAAVAVRRGPGDEPRPSDRRLLAVPPVLVLGVVTFVVAVEVLSFARTAVARRDSYTLASDSLASLSGRSCGVADRLRVESDPRRGLLVAAPDPPGLPPSPAAPVSPAPPGGEPLVAAGIALPGWRGPGVVSGWYALPAPDTTTPPPGARPDPDDDLPLAVAVTGPVLTPGRVALDVADATTGAVTRLPLEESSMQYSVSSVVEAPAARDVRIERDRLPAVGAVRVVTSPDTPSDQGVGVPRAPRTVPWSEVLPPGVPAAVDWPAAFLFPCTPISPLRDGLATLPAWRVSVDARSRENSGYISYTASQGGPWAAARLLVRPESLPVYLPGLPQTDVATLQRWVPVVPLRGAPLVGRERRTEWGTTSPGPLTGGRG